MNDEITENECNDLQKPMSDKTLKNVIDVHKYLKAHAWKISRTQLYEHVETKKLKREDNGIFSPASVDKYALKYLRRADGTKPSKALEELQAKKYMADVRQSVASAEMKELKISILKAEYVRRDAFALALVERSMRFKYDIETFCRSKAADIINLIGGNAEKIPDLIEYLLMETAGWLNCYSEDREFAVPAPSQQLNDDLLMKDNDDDEDDVTKYQA